MGYRLSPLSPRLLVNRRSKYRSGKARRIGRRRARRSLQNLKHAPEHHQRTAEYERKPRRACRAGCRHRHRQEQGGLARAAEEPERVARYAGCTAKFVPASSWNDFSF